VFDLIKQAQKMREEMERIQSEMALRTVESVVGGGMVKVTANGKQEILSVTIDAEMLKLGDKEMLQDLVKAGVNAALKSAQELAAQEVGKLTAGLGPLASMLKGGQ
jgi:nucleoid-associated protein EbfC